MIPSLDETPDRVFAVKGVKTPGGSSSVELGGDRNIRGVIAERDSGESVGILNQINGLESSTPRTMLDRSGAFPGVGPTTIGQGNQFRFEVFAPGFAESKTVSGDERIIINFNVVFTAYVIAQKWRGTQGKMHYDVIDTTTFDGNPTLLYTSRDGDPIDFDNPTTPSLNEVLDINEHPNFQTQNHDLIVEWYSADGNPMTMLGETISGTFVPYIETEYNDFTTRELATKEFASEWYAKTGFTNNSTETILPDTITPVKINGTYVASELSNFTESAGVITYTQTVIPFLSPTAIPYTSIGRSILRIKAFVSIDQKSNIETDILTVGIYKNGALIQNSSLSKPSGVSFGNVSESLDFDLECLIIDATEADEFDVRVVNESNATNVTASNCRLTVGV